TGAPLAAAVQRAREFVAGWAAVAELLDAAEPDEARLLVQHFVEVVELAHESADGRTGTYALRLFPEVRPLDPPHGGRDGGGPPLPPPRGARLIPVTTSPPTNRRPRPGPIPPAPPRHPRSVSRPRPAPPRPTRRPRAPAPPSPHPTPRPTSPRRNGPTNS